MKTTETIDVLDFEGKSVTDKDAAIQGLSNTIHVLASALMASNTLLRSFIEDHMKEEHADGSPCSMQIVLQCNAKILEMFDQATLAARLREQPHGPH